MTFGLTPSASWEPSDITVQQLFEASTRALVLRNVLTRDECEQLIAAGEARGPTSVCNEGYRSNYRNNDRVIVDDVPLAELLMERVRPHIEETIHVGPGDDEAKGIRTIGYEGEWTLDHLNAHWRWCRYQNSGHFSPHNDGDYAPTRTLRSIKTFMLYLNDSFEDGETNFLHQDSPLRLAEDGLYRSDPASIIAQVKPAPGLALVFNHVTLHEGAQVRGGNKYILRSDLMYRLASAPADTPERKEAKAALDAAQRLEAADQYEEAVKMYRKAFRLCPELEKSA